MYLLFDIGGTNLRMAVSEDGNSITGFKIFPTPKDFEQGISLIKQTAIELIGGSQITSIAGCIAGPLDHQKTMLVRSPHLPGWAGKPLKQSLENIFNKKIIIEHDASLAGVGEATFGAGVGKKIVVYLTVSTGLGGGRIVNQRIDINSLGFEPGHQIIEIGGRNCNCGGKGHLESFVGGYYLERDYGKKASEITDQGVWDNVAKYLSIGLCNIIVHWSPDILVLGGAMMQSISLDKVKSLVRQNLTIFPKPPEIVSAQLGHESGLYGALHLLTS